MRCERADQRGSLVTDYLERYPNGYTCHFPQPGRGLAPTVAQAHDRAGSF
jgi:hypothetical protein